MGLFPITGLSDLKDKVSQLQLALSSKADQTNLENAVSAIDELEGDLTLKATKQEVNSLSSQISGLIAHAGDTDGNAELLNIRVDANGTTHTTAGDNVRLSQSGHLYDYNQTALKYGYKKFMSLPFENGGLNYDTGEPLSNETSKDAVRTSTYIELPEKIRVLSSQYRYRLYKYNKSDYSFVSVGNWHTDINDTTVVNDTGYVYKITVATKDGSQMNVDHITDNFKVMSHDDKMEVSNEQTGYLFDYDNSALKYGYKKFMSIPFEKGGLVWNTGDIGASTANTDTVRTSSYVTLPEKIRVISNKYRYRIYKYNKTDYSFIGMSDWYTDANDKIIDVDTTYIYKIVVATTDSSVINLDTINEYFKVLSINDKFTLSSDDLLPTRVQETRKSYVKSVAHQGYNVYAPNNTIHSLIAAKKQGFDAVECDLQWTSDGVAVICHDPTIDATSDGTGTVAEMTYEQLLAYDFGSWKSSEYAGTKIMTFEEYANNCKLYGLEMYVEIKYNHTEDRVKAVIDYTNKIGMLDKCSFMSDNADILQIVKTYSTKSRIGYVVQSYNNGYVDYCYNQLLTGSNKVFIDLLYTQYTDAVLAYARQYGIEVEVWTVDTTADITAVAPYVSGVTSNKYTVADTLY